MLHLLNYLDGRIAILFALSSEDGAALLAAAKTFIIRREMILRAYTAFHVLLSLVGIATGLVVLGGMLVSAALPGWTAVFLWTTFATSATGFFFPYKGFKPSYVVGALSLVLLWLAWRGLYTHGLEGSWRWIYVTTAVASLYLNVFVLVVQAFQKIPRLQVLAPTQSEPIFKKTHLLVLAAFLVLGTLAVRNF